MRIIGLVEADFNTALRIVFARKLMWNVELSGLSLDQWGGRPNRSAPDCATRKLIYWEYGRYMKIMLASFFSDLASCFDRMKTSLSSIAALRKGMPRSVCLSRSHTIGQMKTRVRTAVGTSTARYTGGPDEPDLDGEIQGTATAMSF